MLHLHAAAGAPALADRLADVLAEPLGDPFTPEWIAVPSEGMRRWLHLALARRVGASSPELADGVAANVIRAFPGTLRTVATAAHRRSMGWAAEVDPWSVERLVWSVIDELVDAVDDPGVATVARAAAAARYGRARRIADVFDRYHVHRAAMVRRWAEGDDVDPADRSLPESARWQPALWRRLRHRIGYPSPAETFPSMVAAIGSGEVRLDLPPRLVCFGLSVLPGGADFIDLADAVARHHDLHLFLLDPSPATGDRARAMVAAAGGAVRSRADDDTVAAAQHPLVRSWGRPPRETAVLLAAAHLHGLPPVHPVAEPADAPTATSAATGSPDLLHVLQADIRAGRAPAGDLAWTPADRSIELHATYGAARQAEVLRDVVLHALAEDPTLTEDDIVVLCPDLERFAPLIEAAFGPSAPDGDPVAAHPVPAHPVPAHPVPADRLEAAASPDPDSSAAAAQVPALRYRVADRSLGRPSPAVAAVAALGELVAGRFDAPAVLDFVALPAVRARYDFSDQDITRLTEWAISTNTRWGFDGEHRSLFDVPDVLTAGTWITALDRLLVGAVVEADERSLAWAGIAPMHVDGDDIELAGRFAELLDHLARGARFAARRHRLEAWATHLVELIAAVVAVPDAPWELDGILATIGSLVDEATPLGGTAPCAVELGNLDVWRLLGERLATATARADHLRGGITIAAPDALRSVPHRMVCLVGMDQRSLASTGAEGDDLTANAPWLGDRDPRADGRLAILDAVLAATDRLVLLRDGFDVNTNQPVPPAVVVAELLDCLAATVTVESAPVLADRLEVSHPRQPFDPRCFAEGGVVEGRRWGFDPHALAGARARRRRTWDAPRFLDAPLDPPASLTLTVEDAADCLCNPAQAFLQRRLQARLPRPQDTPSGHLLVTLTALERYKLLDGLLEALLRDPEVDPQELARVANARGELPPGNRGRADFAEQFDQARALVHAAWAHGYRSPASASAPTAAKPSGAAEAELLTLDVDLDATTRIIGTLPVVDDGAGRRLVTVSSSRFKPRHLLEAWLQLVVVTLHRGADPHGSKVTASGPPTAVIVTPKATGGKAAPPAEVRRIALAGHDDHERLEAARRAAADVAELLVRVHCEPVPLFERVSYAVYETLADDPDGKEPSTSHAQSAWYRVQRDGVAGEKLKPAVLATFGEIDFHQLLGIAAQAHDPPSLRPRQEHRDSRVFRYADHLWSMVHRSITVQEGADSSAETPEGGGTAS